MNRTIDDFCDVEDYAIYCYYYDIYSKLISNFDFEKGKWINPPYVGGFMEQEDIEPKKWQIIEYMRYKITERYRWQH